MNAKKLFALLLAVAMVLSVFAGCNNTKPETTTTAPAATQGNNEATEPQLVVETFPEGDYIWKTSVSTLASNWNPHTYQTNDDSVPLDYTTSSLYTFIFNDELNPVEGKDPYEGYVIIPEMAAEMPVDVTLDIKASNPEFGIPESAEAGYAYKIALNPNATWDDGTPITAETYVESFKRLLNPKALNYRAADWYGQTLSIAGAENYYNQGTAKYIDNASLVVADLVKGEDGTYATANGEPVFVNVSGSNAYLGNPLSAYVDAYGEGYFSVTHWEELVAAANEEGYAPLTDDTLAWITDVVTGNPAWGEDETYIPNYIVYYFAYPETFDFANVGVVATGEYELTLVLDKSLAGFDLLYNLSGVANQLVKIDLYDACLKVETGAGGE